MPRNAPHNMDGFAVVIPLQDEDTRPLVIGRVLFDHGALADSREDLPDQDTICSQFLIAVVRDQDLLPCDQVKNALKDLVHQETRTLGCSRA